MYENGKHHTLKFHTNIDFHVSHWLHSIDSLTETDIGSTELHSVETVKAVNLVTYIIMVCCAGHEDRAGNSAEDNCLR